MSIQSYPVQIFPSGEVTPISGWTGGKAKAKIVVETFDNDWHPARPKIATQAPEEFLEAGTKRKMHENEKTDNTK